MAGIGFLFYGVLRAVCAIGRTVDNEQMKKLTMHTDENGNQVCYGRRGQEYINGEKTCMRFQEDKNGHNHALTIGSSSGKVYADSYDKMMNRMERYSEEDKARKIKDGKASYRRYDYDKTVEGDWGIVISEEEYNKLEMLAPSYSKFPSDKYIRDVLWGVIKKNEVNKNE